MERGTEPPKLSLPKHAFPPDRSSEETPPPGWARLGDAGEPKTGPEGGVGTVRPGTS